MENGHRYRLLIYFAALVLCLSVCFAYAESPASVPTASAASQEFCAPEIAPVPTRLLFNTTQGRSSFLPALTMKLDMDAYSDMDGAQAKPFMTADVVLHGLTLQSEHTHGLLHIFPAHHRLKLVKAHAPEHLSAAASVSPQMAQSDEQETR